MKTYRITWVIEVDAESPQEAARIARTVQLDPNSLATCFDVDGEHYDSAEDLA